MACQAGRHSPGRFGAGLVWARRAYVVLEGFDRETLSLGVPEPGDKLLVGIRASRPLPSLDRVSPVHVSWSHGPVSRRHASQGAPRERLVWQERAVSGITAVGIGYKGLKPSSRYMTRGRSSCLARGAASSQRARMDIMSQPQLHDLDLSKTSADPRTFSQCPRVRILAAGVATDVTDAALRALREGGRLKVLRLVSDKPQLPVEVTALATLQRLEIVAPELQGLPREIGRLDRLRTLKVKAFQLGSLPRSIGMLRRLRRLSIDSHQLRRLPGELAELGELRHFRLMFRGHLVRKKWGPRPYFRARFEQTLPELFRLLAQLPRLSVLTLGEPPRVWSSPDPILEEIPPELCLLEALETLTLVDCQAPVRLPIAAPALARLRALAAIRTRFAHSDAELAEALPQTRIERRPGDEGLRRQWEHFLDELPAAEALERGRNFLQWGWGDAALAEEIALGVGWLLHEGGRHRAAVEAAARCERSATTMHNAIHARLLWADATLSAAPHSPDAALAALDKMTPIRLDGLHGVLVAWHWLICAKAFRRLSQTDAEREAIQQAGRFSDPVEPSDAALLRRLRRWLRPLPQG